MIKPMIKQFWNDRRGATVVEYGLIATILATTILLGFGQVSTNLQNQLIRFSTYF